MLYVCKHRVSGTTMFQDFPCENENNKTVYKEPMPKGNVLASESSVGGRYEGKSAPMGYWQNRIGTVSRLENPVENIQLPTLNKVPNLSGSDFIKDPTSRR